ncbi:unnamed protein product [Angiostrongylus costaricensis]|uniref:Pre-mRNA-splicing factor SYF2 n=1 Tax=Angiostrongylus costaricensis TaxID=334426 RepID=A0A0R3PQR3_ANGCS|nr:unnamed protein product [Angiostrongylus costaricensis]
MDKSGSQTREGNYLGGKASLIRLLESKYWDNILDERIKQREKNKKLDLRQQTHMESSQKVTLETVEWMKAHLEFQEQELSVDLDSKALVF